MKDIIRTAIKKVTLELVYEVVDERTKDIKERLDRMEDNMRDMRGEIGSLRNEMNRRFESLNTRIDQLFAILTHQLNSRTPS